MHKLIISSIFVLSILCLVSCSKRGSRLEMLNSNSDEKQANARLEQIIENIKNQDGDALKSMFSKQAKDNAVIVDVDSLFGFIQGKIDSWEKIDGPTVFESNDHDRKKKEVNSYYYVNTDKQKYYFLLQDYPVDTDHPDNVGLYMLLVVNAEDEINIYDGDKKILYDGKKKLTHAGIYLPIK